MPDEHEKKIEALKKAYKEIILNSSKEAATRIIMADHKARRFEQELVSLKEESLSMLIRLKEHFNSMVLESEAKSLKQQMKIDELEAQLNEAEGIIIDLRSELNQVHEQLEFERKLRKKASREHILMTSEPIQESVPRDNLPNSCVISQIPYSNSESINYENKIPSLHPRLLDNKIHAPNDDLSSIIMQNRDSDLCKNGCTQRIRAFEANVTNVRGTTPLSEDKNLSSHVKPLVFGDKTTNHVQNTSQNVDSSSEPLCCTQIDKSKVKIIPFGWLKQRRSSCKRQSIRSPRSSWKNAKYREAITSLKSSNKNLRKPQVKPLISSLKRCYNVTNSETVEIPIGLIELNPKKTKFFQVSTSDKCNYNSENYGGCSSSDQSFRSCDDIQSDSMLVDVPILDGFESSQSQLSRSDKNLKFTFQRKCRKSVLGKIDDNNSMCDREAMKGLENLADVEFRKMRSVEN